jgi:hypothetical protein
LPSADYSYQHSSITVNSKSTYSGVEKEASIDGALAQAALAAVNDGPDKLLAVDHHRGEVVPESDEKSGGDGHFGGLE